ncbi:MAG: DUF5716 family protein [Clostridiales bacterium]|jgi:hypothetical protein|nr:DUF5716 family protein [Clostridiales bacterium]
MNFSWKLYRKRFTEGLADSGAREALFVLGVDLGNHSSSLAFYDINRAIPETVDISGGYGKPSMPTALQYVKESREWVFGEYALSNRGMSPDTLYTHLLDKLNRREYLDVDGKPQTVEYVLAMFLREFLSNCRNLNPKAEIAGVTLSVPGYAADESKAALRQAFALAGWDKSLIAMDSDRECAFSWYFFNNKGPVQAENAVFLDFGARELRGGIYGVYPPAADGEPVRIECKSSLFEKNCGTDNIDRHMTEMLTDYYCGQAKTQKDRLEPRIAGQLQAFAYQHKDLLFQQAPGGKPVKLYYNFVYPPLVQNVTSGIMEAFLAPYRAMFLDFITRLFEKSLPGCAGKEDVRTVICAGGGFEMLWARNAVAEYFSDSRVINHKNPKNLLAEGAAVRSAQALGIIPAQAFFIEDSHKLRFDVGVGIQVKTQNHKQSRFYPITQRNAFWWQEHAPVSFIYTGAAQAERFISLYSRGGDGEMRELGQIALDGLPERPPGATRLALALEFSSFNRLTATVRDLGFGEMFPKSEFAAKQEFVI